jgi:hypothetical protein
MLNLGDVCAPRRILSIAADLAPAILIAGAAG